MMAAAGGGADVTVMIVIFTLNNLAQQSLLQELS
jgi:hypothetical protein